MTDGDTPREPPKAPLREEARTGRIEQWISTLLRAGVLTSLALVTAGTVFTFVHHPDYLTDRSAMRALLARDDAPSALGEVVRGVGGFSGRSMVALGLLVLIATPVMRVALSLGIFLHQRDRIYTVITAVVLALLALSAVLGAVTH